MRQRRQLAPATAAVEAPSVDWQASLKGVPTKRTSMRELLPTTVAGSQDQPKKLQLGTDGSFAILANPLAKR